MSRLFSRELTEPAGRFFSAVAYPVDGAGESWLPARADLFPHWPVTGGVCRRHGKGRELALPFDEDGPFPLPALFCFARVIYLAGRRYAVLSVDERGFPFFSTDF